jgi:PKD repeat protein
VLLLAGLIFAGGTLAVFMAPSSPQPTNGNVAVNRTPDKSRLEIFEQITPTPIPTPTPFIVITPTPLLSPTFVTPLPTESGLFSAVPSIDPTATATATNGVPTVRPTRPPVITPSATRTPRPTGTATATPRPTAPPTSQPAAPVAKFVAAQNGLTLSFDNRSSGSGLTYSWNFGDGGTSKQKDPSHTYGGFGTYTVTLTVSNSSGSDSVSKQFTFSQPTDPPTATPTDNPTPTAPPTPLPTAPPPATDPPPASPQAKISVSGTDPTYEFDASGSKGEINKYEWIFGDGTSDNGVHVTHTYHSNQSFNVVLTVFAPGAADQAHVQVQVNNAAP